MANYQSTHTGAEIDAGIDLLNNNSATQGQVLTADGIGGASWQNAGGGGSGGTQLYRHNLSIQHSGTTYTFSGYSKSNTELKTLNLFKLSEFIIENKLSPEPPPEPSPEPSPTMVTKLYVLFIDGNKIYYLNSSGASIENITLTSGDTISDTVIPL